MAMAVGRGWAYYIVSITITIVLALAANTSFGGLPVLASLVARDNYLPHLFTIRGDRQIFANGIVVLAVMAGALLVAVGGNTNTLIPLFAIGVFIGFTLSQTGLVVHWRKTRPPGWRRRATINGIGACITAIATIVFLVSKFTEGAWVVVIAIPAFVFLFLRIHAYYERARKELRIDEIPRKPDAQVHHRHRAGEPDLAPHRARALRGRVARPGGDRRDGRPATAATRAPTTPTCSSTSGGRGTRACRYTCSTTSTPPSCSRSSASSTRCGRSTPTIRSSCSSRSSGRTSCATGSCTTRSTWCSRPRCAAASDVVVARVTVPLEPEAPTTSAGGDGRAAAPTRPRRRRSSPSR